jgi:hypothetical protein
MSPIDIELSKQLTKEELLKLKAAEMLIELYRDRNMTNIDQFCTSYDKLYKLLKDGETSEAMGERTVHH